ncbi:MAG TPA: signal peptidase II [Stellaceae bacterium]|jgi:signal peptidase II|nr:signal peptidase II [Stellaceae bacterium]
MLRLGLAVAALTAALDQLGKFAVLRHFSEPGCGGHRAEVSSFLDLVVTCNRGVSFGLFNGDAGLNAVVFSLVAAFVVTILVVWLWRVRTGFLGVAIGLVIGGAIGNVIDRLRLGGVVDFLYFHAGSWYWPAFNLADSAICLGVAAMLIDGLFGRRPTGEAESG